VKIEIKNLPKSRVEISFEVSWEEFQPFLDKASLKLSESLDIPGFRKGNIPRDIVEKEIGEERVLSEGAKLLIKKKYPDYVAEKNLEVVGNPEIRILKLASQNPFLFKVSVDVLPKFNLPDYKKIASELEKKEIEVKEEEIVQTLEWLRKSRAKFNEKKEEAKMGDFVEIEYKSSQIENGKNFKDSFFLGKGGFVPGFEEKLLGLKAGEKKEFSVEFPQNHQDKKLAGKRIDFQVRLNKVQEVEFPELNDEFAKELGSFADLEELKKNLREGIKEEKKIAENMKTREEILKNVAKKTEVEIPDSLISLERERLFAELKEKIEKDFNISFDQYLKDTKKSEEEIRESLKKDAEKRVKEFLILREIGKKENIKVGEEEVLEAVNNFLKNFSSIDEVKKLDLERIKDYYRGIIYNEKVLKLLESYVPNNSNSN